MSEIVGTTDNNVFRVGLNTVVDPSAMIGENTVIGHNCVIEEGVRIGKGSRIDSNTVIRKGTVLGASAFVGSGCIIGEYQNDYIMNRSDRSDYMLSIGERCLIRSGTIIYSNSVIGNDFQTGHHVTVREKTKLGDHVSVGTLSDLQGYCTLGDYVRLHSNVHIGQHSIIDDYVWIFPYVILTNDPTPPSENLIGVHIRSFAVIATGSILLPGIEVGRDALVGAGTVVTKNIAEYQVAVGNPSKEIGDVRNIRNKITGEKVYPWREHFNRNMPWEGSTFDSWLKSITFESTESTCVD